MSSTSQTPARELMLLDAAVLYPDTDFSTNYLAECTVLAD